MIERTGDLFSMWGQPNQICIATTNASIRKDSVRLVCGAGSALQLKKHVPRIERILFDSNDHWIRSNHGWYHFVWYKRHGSLFGALQTKRVWEYPSSFHDTAKSISQLIEQARSNPDYTFHVPRPGCGLGGLSWDDQVKTLFDDAPDNIVVWTWPSTKPTPVEERPPSPAVTINGKYVYFQPSAVTPQ